MPKKLPFILLSVLLACQAAPREIEYGQDACAFCKMTVVDQRHAAQLVTEKGRNYVFDAIECMVRYQEETRENYRFQLVADYLQPGQMIPATEAHYLISPEIPSPMGAFLSAFSSAESLLSLPEAESGQRYSWHELPQTLP